MIETRIGLQTKVYGPVFHFVNFGRTHPHLRNHLKASSGDNSRFFSKFSKIEKFQNALKSIIFLRFCSNEYVIEMRCFFTDFWKRLIWKNFLKNFRSPKKFENFEFFFKILKNLKNFKML